MGSEAGRHAKGRNGFPQRLVGSRHKAGMTDWGWWGGKAKGREGFPCGPLDPGLRRDDRPAAYAARAIT
jgi:hypothetical protein